MTTRGHTCPPSQKPRAFILSRGAVPLPLEGCHGAPRPWRHERPRAEPWGARATRYPERAAGVRREGKDSGTAPSLMRRILEAEPTSPRRWERAGVVRQPSCLVHWECVWKVREALLQVSASETLVRVALSDPGGVEKATSGKRVRVRLTQPSEAVGSILGSHGLLGNVRFLLRWPG